MEFGKEFSRTPGLACGEIDFFTGILREVVKFRGSGFEELDEFPVSAEHRAARPAAADVTGEVPEHIPSGKCALTLRNRRKAAAVQWNSIGCLHAGQIQHGRIPIHAKHGDR